MTVQLEAVAQGLGGWGVLLCTHMSDCFPCTDHMGERFHREATLVISVPIRGDVSAQVTGTRLTSYKLTGRTETLDSGSEEGSVPNTPPCCLCLGCRAFWRDLVSCQASSGSQLACFHCGLARRRHLWQW